MSFRLLCFALIMSAQSALAEVGIMESTGPYLAPARGPMADKPKEINLAPLSKYSSVYSSQSDRSNSSPRLLAEAQSPPETSSAVQRSVAKHEPYVLVPGGLRTGELKNSADNVTSVPSAYGSQRGTIEVVRPSLEVPLHKVSPRKVSPRKVSSHIDPKVQPAIHDEPVVSVDSSSKSRLLRPSPHSSKSLSLANRKTDRKSERRLVPNIPMSTTVATIGGMSLVIGLFLVSIWLVKRGMPKSNAVLPEEVVSLLGRRQLSARQTMQMLRVGNKLVLVSVTPDGTEPITEVTDPAEVDRILGLCQQSHGHSSTAEFQHVLDQLTRQPSGQGLFSAGNHPAGDPAASNYPSGTHTTGSQFG